MRGRPGVLHRTCPQCPACLPAATEVALRTANLCYIPYQPTESDHDRATEAVSVRGAAGEAPACGLPCCDTLKGSAAGP